MEEELEKGKKEEDMKDNKILVILVCVLAVALVGETIYLWSLPKKKHWAGTLSLPRQGKMHKPSRMMPRNQNAQSANFGVSAMPSAEVDPFKEIERVRQQMDRAFQDNFTQPMPRMNINLASGNRFMNLQADVKKTDNAYVIQMDVPGMKKEEINIDIQGNMLTISGQRNNEVSQEEKDAGIVSQEREFGFFSRSLSLPADVNKEGIKASCENGVLSVTLPRVVFEKPLTEQTMKIKVE